MKLCTTLKQSMNKSCCFYLDILIFPLHFNTFIWSNLNTSCNLVFIYKLIKIHRPTVFVHCMLCMLAWVLPLILGSNRSPRRGNFVCLRVWDIMLRMALKEILHHSKESSGVAGARGESKAGQKSLFMLSVKLMLSGVRLLVESRLVFRAKASSAILRNWLILDVYIMLHCWWI